MKPNVIPMNQTGKGRILHNLAAAMASQWLGLCRWTMTAVLLCLLSMAGTARAQSVTNVIYVDNFARSGQLVGTMPDTVNFPGARWIGGVPTNGIVTDGTEAAVTNKLQNLPWATAYLPLNIETGHVYTVSCSIYGNPNDNQQWMSLGFAVAPGQANNFTSGNVGVGWLLSRCSNNGCQFFGGGGTGNNFATLTYGGLSTFMNYSVVLNTATNPVKWSVTIYTNGVFGGTFAYPSFPTAENGTRPGYVGIGETSNARGNFKNFSVTDVVLTPQAPTVLEQPNNLTAQVGHTATFWVSATGLPDPTYQWETNAVGSLITNVIVGATNATYTTPALSSAYNNLNYSVVMTTPAGSTVSSPGTLTVIAGQPTVFSATKTSSRTNVVVNFSGPVDPVTGLNPANYGLYINGAPSGVSIIAASAGSVPGSVVLQTSLLDTNAGYYLFVKNVQDLFGEAITSNTNSPVLPAGLAVYLRGDSGVQLDGSGNVVQWLDQTTNANNAQQFFGMSVNVASEYVPGAQSRPSMGNIGVNSTPAITFTAAHTNFMTVPPAASLALNGNQTLYVFANPSSFGAARALINENVGNLPAPFDFETTSGGGTIVCQVGDGSYNVNESSGGAGLTGTEHTWVVTSQDIGTNSGASATPITNNTSYYIDGQPYGVLFNNYNLNAPGAVYAYKPLYIGWRQDGPHIASPIMDGQMGEILLFNQPLSGADRTNVDNYIGQKYYSFSAGANLPSSVTSSNGYTVTYTYGAYQGPLHFSYQWQVNGTNIPGATSQSYTTPVLGPGNSNTTYDVVLTFPNGTTFTSGTSTLTVLPAPPFVASAGLPLWEAAGSTNIIVLFNEAAVDPVTAATVGNYSLNSGSVLSAVMGAESNKVILTTTPLAAWNANPGNYSLTVQNVKDIYGQTMATASTPVGIYPATTALWLDAKKGIVIDSGNSAYAGVQEWDDQSGNQDDLFQQNGPIFEPVLTNNSYAHGLPTIQFTGTNVTTIVVNSKTVGVSTFLTSENNNANDYPALKISGDISIFSVVSLANVNGGTNGEILGKTGLASANQPSPYDYYVGAATNTTLYRGNGTNSGNFSVISNFPSVIAPHVLAVNEAGSTVSHFVDGAPAGTGVLNNGWNESFDADQAQALQLGERGDYVNRLNGSISELILIGQALDSNEVVAINNYLISKYSIPTGTNAYPVIIQQPVPSTNLDQNTTLTVPTVVTGNPLAIQWYDTNNIAQAGQTNATLTINNIQTSDSYYLVATNIFASVTSSVVRVTVFSGLNVTLGPTNVTLYQGLPSTFTAQALGNAPFYYQWYQGASPIPNATNSTYTATATLGSTAYSCTVTNGYNGISSTNAGPIWLTGIALPTNAFSQTLLSDGPIAYWRLNEPAGSTNAYDYVGGYNGYYGANTTNGLPGVPLAGSPGELGVAMDSSVSSANTNGYVTTPGINLTTSNLTLLCWVYSFASQVNPSGLVFLRDNNNINVLGSQVGGANTLDYTWANNSATYTFNSGITVPQNSWSLTALVITPSQAQLYVFNSSGVGSAANVVANPPQSLATGFALGSDPQAITSNRTFNGQMNEVAIFNYPLSFGQLQQLYTAATTGSSGAVNTNPTNIMFSVSGGNLTLSWPADHTGWQLQAQTNSLTVGITTNWVNVANSTGTNQIMIPMNLTNGSVFYRLVYP